MKPIAWLLLRTSSVPAGNGWLGPRERLVQATLALPKRRSEWRLGRFTAKQLLSRVTAVEQLDRIQVVAAEDGAPEAFIDEEPFPASLSITHRSGVAACVVAEGARAGCDLEAIEPRTQRFIDDYFTERERECVMRTAEALHDRHVALIWSAKESALKVLRVGLRRDTRRVEADIGDPGAEGSAWRSLEVDVSPENLSFPGWWRQDRDVVLTVACDDPSLRIAGHDEER